MLEINVLGNLNLTLNGENLDSLSLRAQVLLVYLALENGQHSRPYLASMLWPESSESKANTSLRVVLTELRKTVGNYLNINRNNIGFCPDAIFNLDLFEFEKSIHDGRIEDALQLYRGDFLTGVFITGSNEFENWHRWERDRIRLYSIRQIEEAILRAFALNNFQATAKIALGLLKIDPINEIANQYYSIALALDNLSAVSIQHLDSYINQVEDQLGLPVSPEITTIRELIKAGDLKSLVDMIKPNHNLPPNMTGFVGRESDIATITNLLANPDCRLINLIGPGGIGKTRLVLQAIRENMMRFPDGVYFVPVEELISTDDIIPAIAKVLNFRFGTIVSMLDPQTQLIDYLQDLSLIIILDGIEHLTDCTVLISKLLSEVPKLKFMTTSRHKLNLEAEWVHMLQGLPYQKKLMLDKYPDAISLFIERVNQINPQKTFNAEEVDIAYQICSLVEGMPLGIELAAAWTSVLELSRIAKEIERNYGFLEKEKSDKLGKHHSLQAVFNYSWDLLDTSQQDILLRLSVFRGNFSHKAAKDVCRTSLSNLSSLLDKSLIQKDHLGQFKLHPMVRQFSQEHLIKDQNWLDIKQKHCRYFARHLNLQIPGIFEVKSASSRTEVQSNLPNILAAAEFAILNPNLVEDLSIIQDLFTYFLIQGWHEGGLTFQHFAELLESEVTDKKAQTRVLLAKIQAQRGFFYSNLGIVDESEDICQESLLVLENQGEIRELAICKNNLGVNAIFSGEYDQAYNYLEDAIELGQKTRCYSYPSYDLWMGYLNFLLGDYEKGLNNLFTSRELFSSDKNHWGEAFSLSKIGLAKDGLGLYSEAIEYHQKSLDIFQITGDHAGQGYALSRMSLGALLLENFEEALDYGRQGLEHFTESGHRWGICVSLLRIGYANLGLGNKQEAGEFFKQALQSCLKHNLEPLSLHGLAGIAIYKLISGKKSNAIELIQFVNNHPKTPAIYKDLSQIWFNKKVSVNISTEIDQGTNYLNKVVNEVLSEMA
jgi:predicted ATPase/DNA-binding SARP family transcriptional activator